MKDLIIIIIMIGLVLLYIFFLPFRLTILHPFLTLKYACIDIFNYFRYKRWNEYKCGVFSYVCYWVAFYECECFGGIGAYMPIKTAT